MRSEICYACAPLEGITGYRFRNAHRRWFGGVDRYYAPFFSPDQTHRLPPRDRRELCPEHNPAGDTVPQLLTRSAEDFLWAARVLEDMGYGEVNLNLGCPSGTVTAKGKGAGFLARPAELERFLDEIFQGTRLRISIKTRLGYAEPEEFAALLALYNRYPVAELIVHTRVRSDFYRLPARPELLPDILAHSAAPVCYNGDLFTQADCLRLTRSNPDLRALMLGRGLLCDPALARKLRGGAGADKDTLRAFLDELYQGYCQDFGSAPNAVRRMQELWTYLLCLFEESGRHRKQLRKAKHAAEYEAAVAAIFRELELQAQGAGSNETLGGQAWKSN